MCGPPSGLPWSSQNSAKYKILNPLLTFSGHHYRRAVQDQPWLPKTTVSSIKIKSNILFWNHLIFDHYISLYRFNSSFVLCTNTMDGRTGHSLYVPGGWDIHSPSLPTANRAQGRIFAISVTPNLPITISLVRDIRAWEVYQFSLGVI